MVTMKSLDNQMGVKELQREHLRGLSQSLNYETKGRNLMLPYMSYFNCLSVHITISNSLHRASTSQIPEGNLHLVPAL